MRIVFIGCVEFSHHLLQTVMECPEVEVVGIVTLSQSAFNSDFLSLAPLGKLRGIPVFFADREVDASIAPWLRALTPDVVYCFGWSKLLSADILSIPALGVVGYHPAALPRNRGRHPIIWALALGLIETASTFFQMDEGADSGAILSQRAVRIEESDDAASLYRKLEGTAAEQVISLSRALSSGDFVRRPQDHSAANVWRKRTKADGQIDWRMASETIHNLVRALTRPYPGAHCLYRGSELKVWRTRVVSCDGANLEPGKVLDSDERGITVKCGVGAVQLVEHEFFELPAKGSYL